MIHLGDITLIKGNDAPVVDCIIGGSPCQDLSVAGKREGLSGARSGLYMEQIRIIKEMRQADAERGNTDVDIRPRYMVWENVPGAFSTNQGQDFAAVLEEAIRVAEPEVPSVPVPEKGWSTSGCLLGDKWSIAWRVLDAQFWGTSSKPLPQRRRRIALIADFGGQSAPEILFVKSCVSGNTQPSEKQRQTTSNDVGEGSGGASEGTGVTQTVCLEGNGSRPSHKGDGYAETDIMYTLNTVDRHAVAHPVTFEPGIARREGGHIYEGVSGTLRANAGDNQMAIAYSLENHPQDSRVNIDTSGMVQTLTSRMGTGGGNVPMVMELAQYYEWHSQDLRAKEIKDNVSPTLSAGMGMGGASMTTPMLIQEPICINERQYALTCSSGTANTLTGTDYKGVQLVAIPDQRVKYIVRRLTPLECERLQGYPDGWTDIGEWVDSNGKTRKLSDSARYKALGNSIALPPWKWVLKRLCACYERDATMASLFDGIGGFPLIWEQLNGKGSCLWASEIEEFPIAVTKLRFGDGS